MPHYSKSKTGEAAGILLPMGLVCLFAFCSLALALMGGQAYRQIQASVAEGFDTTVAAGYLRTKLSQFNHGGTVSLRNEDGVQVLAIESTLDGTAFETRIYLYEGRLMENFERADAPFFPVGGMQVARLESCAFSLGQDGLFTAEMVGQNGEAGTASFAMAQGGGV